MAAEPNYHTLGSFKQHTLFSYSFRGWKSEININRLKSRCGRAGLLLKVQERICSSSLSFQKDSAHHSSCLSLCHPNPLISSICLCICSGRCLTLIRIPATPTSQGVSKSLTTSEKSLLPKATYSEVWVKIRTQITLKGIYLAYLVSKIFPYPI